MAHAIEQFTDGSAAFFSNRMVPWHALGTVTDGALTAEQALDMAQLNWQVYKTDNPVTATVITDDGVSSIEIPDKFATYRNHPKLGMQGLGVVGKQYHPIQNSEAFDFLNYIVDEGGAVFETAGSLNGGRQVFMSMRLPKTIILADGQDTVDMYLMASTSHDGTKAFTAAVTPIRPVCANTVRLALSKAKSTWYMRHTPSASGKIAQAREALGLAFAYTDAFQKAVDDLVSSSFTDQEFVRMVETLVKDDADATDRQKRNVGQIRGEMFGMWNAPTQANVKNTRWAAYNAIVEWADWAKPIKAKGGNEMMVRAERILTGGVDGIKDRAYALLSI